MMVVRLSERLREAGPTEHGQRDGSAPSAHAPAEQRSLEHLELVVMLAMLVPFAGQGRTRQISETTHSSYLRWLAISEQRTTHKPNAAAAAAAPPTAYVPMFEC